jgi:hypothetical protein
MSEIDEWGPIQMALEESFFDERTDAIGGKHLLPLMDGESRYGAHLVTKFKGYDIVENCFFDFFMETLEIAAGKSFFGQLPKSDNQFIIMYLMYFSSLRALRSASILKNNGYPLAGFGLMREVKNRAIHLGGVAAGITGAAELNGFDPTSTNSATLDQNRYRKIKMARKREQGRVTAQMVGAKSGLREEDIEEMAKIRDFYHDEVHGWLMTFFEDFKTLAIDKKLPSFLPQPHHNDSDAGMYMNRGCEVIWMLLRDLPNLQLEPRSFGEDWAKRWTLLDKALHLQVRGLGDLGKRIAGAVTNAIEEKFCFSPDTHYRPFKGLKKP